MLGEKWALGQRCERSLASPRLRFREWHAAGIEHVDRSLWHFLLPRGKRRTRLEHWFDAGVQRLHCIPWEAETGLRWAEMLATLRASGRALPIKDSLIAATALVHDLIVVTRNRADFESAGVEVVDPWRWSGT